MCIYVYIYIYVYTIALHFSLNVFNAMVVRTVKRKEMLSTPAAMKAMGPMGDEWGTLSKQMVWDLTTVREQDDAAAKGRHTSVKVHFGDIFGICGLKGSEFKKDDPAQKRKGRLVFRGSDVKDGCIRHCSFQWIIVIPGNVRSIHSSRCIWFD